MNSILHQIADEKISDVYAENERFTSLLEEYYNTQSKAAKDEIWLISFRAACNLLKKRFGSWWTYDEIEELAIDMVVCLLSRIDNRKKWPNGYKVLNLPTTLEYIMLNFRYGKNIKEQREFERKLKDYNDNYATFTQ